MIFIGYCKFFNMIVGNGMGNEKVGGYIVNIENN